VLPGHRGTLAAPVVAMAPVIQKGTVLANGRYRIRKELNRGGTAVVYEADDLETSLRVALKVMNTRDGVMTMPIKAVKREIEIASSMTHPNIVRLIDVFAEDTRFVIVWELVSGPDLLDLLNACNGRMTEKQAAHYFRQIHQGVTFLHENGLCHRDLKPENCMVDSKTDTLKIIDFGLSKHLESAVTLGVGTPDYMAPEMLGYGSKRQANGDKYDARAVDVWAMGVMLYLMVAGVYPFEDPDHPDNVAHTLQNVRDGRIRPLPAGISNLCADLIAKMLHKKAHRRLTLESVLKHQWLIQNLAPKDADDKKREQSTKEKRRRSSAKVLSVDDADALSSSKSIKASGVSKTRSEKVSSNLSARHSKNQSRSGFNKLINRLSHLGFGGGSPK